MNYPDFETLCRLCLKEGVATVNIFNDMSAEKQISVPMRIMACVALEVQANDALPKSICSDCRYQLEKTFVFRKRAQISDSKLRKHIRLLNARKISNVFEKNEDDDEEYEFEESLEFLREQEQEQDQDKVQELEKLRLEYEGELEQVKNAHAAKLAKEVKERCALLKKEMWAEAKKKVRADLEAEIREKLREECMAIVKDELRVEVKDECRQIEMERLLNDLELFLQEKRNKKTKITLPPISSAQQKSHKNTTTNNRDKNINKRNRSPEPTARLLRFRKCEDTSLCKTEDNALEQVVHESFEVITKQLEKFDDNENRETENFFIVDTESNMDKAEYIERLEDDNYEGSEDGEQYPASSDNNNTEMALYQIKANGEISTLDKGEENVVYLNMEDVADEEQVDMMEFVDMKVQTKNKTTTTFYASSKSNDVTKISGYTKVSIKNNDKTDSEHDEQSKIPYGTATDTPKTFKCEICPMVFSTVNTLNRHYRTHERSEKKGVIYECIECHVIFSCRSALNRHAVIHTGQRPYKCDECGKAFVQREILKRHQKVHTGERPHQCPHCPRAYTQKVNLQQHINHNHSKMPKLHQHSCHLCPKRFNHASGLSRHLTTHSGITYQCIECDRSFGDRSSVKRHVMTVHMPHGDSSDVASKFIKECLNRNNDKKTNDTAIDMY